MKKLLTLLSLLMVSIGAMAKDSHWTINDKYPNQGYDTWIVAKFVSNERDYYNQNKIDVYEVAAFVGDEENPRATATPTYSTDARAFQVVLQIKGDTEDGNKPITFRVYNSETGNEYYLVCSNPNEITWSSETATYRPTLTLTVPSSVELGEITMNVGESVNLMDYLTVYPSGASLPLGIAWRVAASECATIVGNTLTAVKTVDETQYYVTMGAAGQNNPLTASGKLHINQIATGITIKQSALTFRIGEDEGKLTELMITSSRNPYWVLTPEGATAQVSWDISDPTVIGTNAAGTYALLKAGTTTMTPYVPGGDGQEELRPSDPDAITITVVQPVTSIKYYWSDQGKANMANVNENVFSRLERMVIVKPENATNQAYTFEANHLLDNGTMDKDGVMQGDAGIVFTKVGYYSVTVTSEDNPRLSDVIKFQVLNPAKEVTLDNTELNFVLNDNVNAIKEALNNNIHIGPDGYATVNGTIKLEGDALTLGNGGAKITTDGAEIDLIGANEGTATVNVTVEWNDYSNYDGTENSITKQNDTKSFTVNIVAGLQRFAVTHTPGTNGTGTLKFDPIPSNASYDADEILIGLSSSGYPESWTTISSNRSVANGVITVNYTAGLPGSVSVSATSTINGAVTTYDLVTTSTEGVPEEFTGFTVPATYSFASGWQWRSNSYGKVSDEMNTFFNETFVRGFGEARTQTALIINDEFWGLFATDGFSIGQGDCYKILMKSAASTTLTSGSFVQEAKTVSLNKGWTWVGSPFVYDRLLTNAFNDLRLPTGTRIVSKNSGFAEWNGTVWTTGTLAKIEKNQGYLIYCPSDGYNLPFKSEAGMSQGDEPAAARSTNRSVWRYDDSKFADNMSMVAKVKDIDDVEHYTVGAFVDGECRGEGVAVEGWLFITVHANSGEQVTFRLHNELTGEYFEVAESVKFQQMLGSLTAPVSLSVPAFTTGINDVTRHSDPMVTESYDLLGRKNPNAKLTIIRTADGKMRKVLK